jgi:hypothetical protein
MRVAFRVLGTSCLLVLAACSNGNEAERFLASLSGQNEVPPQPSTFSSGLATFEASGDAISYAVTVQNITGVTDVQIHSGAGGVVGPAIADLYNGPTTGPIVSTTLTSGTISASNLSAISLDSLKALMRSGNAYVNITTTARPNGEIRGQVIPN